MIEDYVHRVREDLSEQEFSAIYSMSEDDFVVGSHHDLGRYLRNSLSLWDPKSKIHQYFLTFGIWHADDMSAILTTCLHRSVNGKPMKLEEQFEFYHNFWQKQQNESNVCIRCNAKITGTKCTECDGI